MTFPSERKESRSKSKETILADCQVQKIGDNMFDIKMGLNSELESLEAKYPTTMIKSLTEKFLPPVTKKIKKTKIKREKSKNRLAFILAGSNSAKQDVDPSLKKRKEIIQELRLSAAKIVVES